MFTGQILEVGLVTMPRSRGDDLLALQALRVRCRPR